MERKNRWVHIDAHIPRFPRLHLPYHQQPIGQTVTGDPEWYTWEEFYRDAPESRFLIDTDLPS